MQLSFSLFQIRGTEKLNFSVFVLILGTDKRTDPDNMKGRDGS